MLFAHSFTLSAESEKKTRPERQRPPWMRGKKPKFHNGFRARSLFPIHCPLSLSLPPKKRTGNREVGGSYPLIPRRLSFYTPLNFFVLSTTYEEETKMVADMHSPPFFPPSLHFQRKRGPKSIGSKQEKSLFPPD